MTGEKLEPPIAATAIAAAAITSAAQVGDNVPCLVRVVCKLVAQSNTRGNFNIFFGSGSFLKPSNWQQKPRSNKFTCLFIHLKDSF